MCPREKEEEEKGMEDENDDVEITESRYRSLAGCQSSTTRLDEGRLSY